MDAKKESHCWWFESPNSLNSSPWLQSTLSELNEKTKTMLKLVEDDADSFAQRAEMYYKKRPELISMVEDFYRAYRSLAERYDQLKCDRNLRIRSPLRFSSSLPKDDEYENLFDSPNSVKSIDTFTETVYSSDESDVSELEGDSRVNKLCIEAEKEKSYSAWVSTDKLTELREELDRLREENKAQKNHIRDNYQEKEELVNQLENNINELKKFREECEAINAENSFIPVKQYHNNAAVVTAQFEEEKKIEMTRLLGLIKSLKLECVKLREVADEKDGEMIEIAKKFEEVKDELEETEAENRCLKDALVLKEILFRHEQDEKTKAARLFEEAKIELMKLRQETETKNRYTENKLLREEQLKLEEAKKELEKMREKLMQLRDEMQKNNKCFKRELAEKDDEKRAVIKQLSLAMEILREDNELLRKTMVKELTKLREETQKKDVCLVKALAEKDEEKRAVIRQLSLAVEILREDNQLLKKSVLIDSPKKGSSSQLQMFMDV